MKARLLILVSILAVVLVVVLTRDKPQRGVGVGDDDDNEPTWVGKGERPSVDDKKSLAEIDVPGAEPAAKPVIEVTVRPDDSTGQNRVYFTLTEKHGFFVETMRVRYFYSPSKFQKKDDESEGLFYYVNDYIRANDTLEVYTQLTPVEMKEIGGNMGTAENWRAEVLPEQHGRWREKNPDPSWPGYKIRKPK